MGQCCVVGSKAVACILGYHIQTSSTGSTLLLIQLPDNGLGKVVQDAHVFGPMSPKWETQLKLLASGFRLAQPWLIQLPGEGASE